MHHDHPYQRELEVALEAAHKAADQIRYFSEHRNELTIQHKDTYDLVTNADMASEKIILAMLKAAFPEDQFLGEETGGPQHMGIGRCWIVDPLDGTTNFSHNFSPYCVSIALYEHLTPLVSVVLEVSHQELFVAVKDQGAYYNDQPVKVSSVQSITKALIGTGFPVDDGYRYDALLKVLKGVLEDTQGIRRTGSASYDLCCVAVGKVEAFYEVGLKPWDVAAAGHLVLEAGGKVTDFSGGGSWLYGREIVAGTEKIQSWLAGLIQKVT